MKRIYLKPESKSHMLRLGSKLLTASPDIVVDPNGSVEAGNVESRRNRFSDMWDDED